MTERLDGTVALITGASSGIGEATARELAARGSTVVLAARRRDRLDVVVEQILAAGGTAFALEVDLAQTRRATDAVTRTISEFGRLDTLVNNAGLMLIGPAESSDPADWERMLDLNVRALLATTRAALPHLLAAAETSNRRVADIVNISSTAGRFARGGTAAYAATKHAVSGFSEALRQEVTARHLRVSLVEPGTTRSELLAQNPAAVRDAVQGLMQFEPLEASDIAEAVAYIVTRPRRVAVNEMLVRGTEQER